MSLIVDEISKSIQETCYSLEDAEIDIDNPNWWPEEARVLRGVRERLQFYLKNPELLLEESELVNLSSLDKQIESVRGSLAFWALEKETQIINAVESASDLIIYFTKKIEKTNLIKTHGYPSTSQIISIEEAVSQLIDRLGPNPKEWYDLGFRKFEEILAEIWNQFGWQTILTPPSKDGGIDVRAIRNENGLVLCYLIEAKCYNPERPVGIDIVRSLYGVVERERATHGIIATTSYFTKGALQESRALRYRVSLADFDQVYNWVKRYRSISRK